jgi:hypothetical protein
LAGKVRRSQLAKASSAGRLTTQVGERCSMVTDPAVDAIAGTRVMAVAPLPITTTFRPV